MANGWEMYLKRMARNAATRKEREEYKQELKQYRRKLHCTKKQAAFVT